MVLFPLLPACGYLVLLFDDFYYLSGLTGLIISLAGVILYLRVTTPKLRSLAGIALIPFLYWFTGGAYLVFVSLVIVYEALTGFCNKIRQCVSFPVILIFLVLAITLPVIGREYIFKDTLLQAYLSGAYYKISIFFPLPLIMLFASFPVFTLIQYFLPENFTAKQTLASNIISVLFLMSALVTGMSFYGDFKSENVMTYDNLAYRGKWDRIINKAEKDPPSDPVSLVALNLALAQKGALSQKMFQFDQKPNSLFLDYERKGMTPLLAGEPYFQLGLYNFAQMFAMETIESTPDARYPARSFKRMAETFIINGQYDIALKYLTPLSRTIFYRKWAKECISKINNEGQINSDAFWTSRRELMSDYDFFYNISQTDIALRYLLISDPANKTAYEYLMAYYLLQKDLDGFLIGLQMAEDLNYKTLPGTWQEAASYIRTRVEQVPPVLEKYEISKDVINRLKSYAVAFSESDRDTAEIRKEFGNTYWYYLHFK